MRTQISVVMPAYNAEKFLSESIDSILFQDFPHFEFIIINDNSTDQSNQIIKLYSKKDNRIKQINNSKHLGVTASLNLGLKIASAKYIARMDADDISLKSRFRIQLDYLEKNKNIFLIGTNSKVISEQGKDLYSTNQLIDPHSVRENLYKNNCITHPSIMFRNEKFFYREKFSCTQDYDFYLCLLSSKKNLSNIKDLLIKYRTNTESVSYRKKDLQLLLNQYARIFYRERIINGNDSYDSFDIKNLRKNIENDRVLLLLDIKVKIVEYRLIEARNLLNEYIDKYGIEELDL